MPNSDWAKMEFFAAKDYIVCERMDNNVGIALRLAEWLVGWFAP